LASCRARRFKRRSIAASTTSTARRALPAAACCKSNTPVERPHCRFFFVVLKEATALRLPFLLLSKFSYTRSDQTAASSFVVLKVFFVFYPSSDRTASSFFVVHLSAFCPRSDPVAQN
jgi:hypothetical protein